MGHSRPTITFFGVDHMRTNKPAPASKRTLFEPILQHIRQLEAEAKTKIIHGESGGHGDVRLSDRRRLIEPA
jgi:hypothetical protein